MRHTDRVRPREGRESRNMTDSKVFALVVSAGRGMRAGGGLPKQYRKIAGKPVLAYTLSRFANHPRISAVRTVIHPDDRVLYDNAAEGLAVLPPVHGGATRQDSVRLGLESLQSDAPDIVLIHDAARPFVSEALISGVIEAIGRDNGAIPALAVTDTIKRAHNGTIETTVDRSTLWRAQTPQGFPFAPLLAAHRDVIGQELTDDAAVAEAAGMDVKIVPGSDENFKITAPDDFNRAENLLNGDVMATQQITKTGMGFDVHRFEAGDKVILCGIDIPHTAKLAGHSDADVGLHAITDALLGALGDGDIGDHFPPSDPQWKGAPSDKFLAFAADRVRTQNGDINHVDVTLICERPKVGPHREAMRARLAEIMSIPITHVSVKATTTEKLGFTGREEGIAAQAVATISVPQ